VKKVFFKRLLAGVDPKQAFPSGLDSGLRVGQHGTWAPFRTSPCAALGSPHANTLTFSHKTRRGQFLKLELTGQLLLSIQIAFCVVKQFFRSNNSLTTVHNAKKQPAPLPETENFLDK